MKQSKQPLVTYLFLTLFSVTSFSQGLKINNSPSYKEAETFLFNLGFENYIQKAQHTLATEQNLDVISKAALQKTLKYYLQIEGVKNISALTYALLDGVSCGREQVCVERDMVIQTIVQQTQSFPLISLEPFAEQARKGYQVLQGEEASDYRIDYLESRGVERYNLEKQNILRILKYVALRQRLLSTAEEVKNFEKHVDQNLHEILEPNYLPNTRQQNRHLGRGLTAVYIKWAQEKKCISCVDKLKTAMRKHDVQLEQVIGANFRMKNNEQDKLLQLKNGDLALEYSSGGQSYLISMGLKPTQPDDLKIAKEHKLINSYGKMPLVVLNPGYGFVKNRQHQNYPLTEDQERLLQFHWDPNMSRGFSHVGIVEVKQDPKTKISLAWIWDIFPQNDRVGVVRPMTPEGFAYPERFTRIGFARYNPEKMRQKFLLQKQTRGFMSVVWKSSGSKMAVKDATSERLVPLMDATTNYEWPSLIQQNELEQLIEKSKNMSGDEWFNNEALPRVFSQIRDYIYGRNALVFAKDLVNAKSMAYCSQLITLAYLQSLNFDLQTNTDKYRSLPHLAGTIAPSMLTQKVSDRIIAPAGLVWQSDATEMVVQMNFSRERIKAQQELDANGKSVAQRYADLTYFPTLDQSVSIVEPLQEINKEKIDNDDDED